MLQEFDWEVRDKKGSKNLIADYLSILDQEELNKSDDGVPINESFCRHPISGQLDVDATDNSYYEKNHEQVSDI